MSIQTEIQRIKNNVLSAFAAITANGGTYTDDNSDNMSEAIASIPHGGGSLPTLNNPATSDDVLAGKQVIDGDGNKMIGTLSVCSVVSVDNEDQPPYVSFGVAYAPIRSNVDGSTGFINLDEPDALPENILKGKNILGVDGMAEAGGGGLPTGIAEMSCGTFTAATDMANTTLAIPHGLSAAPNFFFINRKDNRSSGNGAKYILGAVYDARGNTTISARLISNSNGMFTNNGMSYSGTYSSADGFHINALSEGGYGIKAGDYEWVAIRFEEA